jgi:membrane fusion protein (multidrug efflux system)
MRNEKTATSKLTAVAGLLILVCLALVAVNVWRARNQKETTIEKTDIIPVAVVPAATGELDWYTELTGDLKPMESADLFAKIPGKIIEQIFVEKGDWVKKGERVASLEKNQITAQRNRTVAAVEVAQTQVTVLEKDYLRTLALYKEKAAPKQKLDHIEAERMAAKAGLTAANAALKELDVVYHDHDIYATLSGIVADRFVDPGNLSSPQMPILRISKEKMLKMTLTVPETEFSHLQKGMAVTFAANACPDRTFSGTVALIYPTADPLTRTIRAEAHIPNDDRHLRSGMFVHARLYFGKKQALLIRREALNKMPGAGDYYVYVVRDNKARLQNITAGIQQGNQVEVTSGLAAGDPVVIQGQNRLKDNIPVEIIKTAETEKP